ncbi:MAG: hypothetical protein WD595_00535 [Waddliaceae bacterium]
MSEVEKYLTNERLREKATNQFQLVNALIKKVQHNLRSGREESRSHHENPVLDVLDEALSERFSLNGELDQTEE